MIPKMAQAMKKARPPLHGTKSVSWGNESTIIRNKPYGLSGEKSPYPIAHDGKLEIKSVNEDHASWNWNRTYS